MAAKEEKIFTPAFNLLIAVSLLLYMSLSSLLFFLPVYILNIGGSGSTAGLAAGIYMFVAVVTRPFLGAYIDNHGYKKIALAGIATFCLSNFLYMLSQNVAVVLLLRALQGAAWGAVKAATFTMAAEFAPAKRQGEALGYFSLTTPAGMAFGPAITELIFHRAGYTAAFAFIGVLPLFALIASFFFREAGRREEGEVQERESQKGKVFRAVVFPSYMALMVAFCYGTVVTFLPVLGQIRGITNVGLFFTLYSIVLVSTRPFAGKVIDRLGYLLTVGASMVFISLSLLVIAFSQGFRPLLLGSVLLGFGTTVSYPSLMKLVVVLSSPKERGRAMAVFTAFQDLGIGIGSTGFGFLLNISSITTVFLTCAGLLFTSLLMIMYPELRLLDKKLKETGEAVEV